MGTALQSGSIDSTNKRGTAITAGGTAHTKNATWTQLISSTSAASTMVYVGLQDIDSTARLRFFVDIGYGPSSPPSTIIISNLFFGQTNNPDEFVCYNYDFPLAIPIGSKVWTTCQCSTASRAVAIDLKLGFDPNCTTTGTSVQALGADTDNTRGAAIDMVTGGVTGNTPWATIGTTASAYKGLCSVVGRYDATDPLGKEGFGLAEIGIGSSPSAGFAETAFGTGGVNDMVSPVSPYLSIAIPTSTILAMRLKRGASLGATNLSGLTYGVV